MPFFSIIVPVYNCQNYITDCLDSILNQSFQDFEVICVDDGSTDDSHVILNKYKADNSNICVVSQSNSGPGGARNSGIEKASGEWLVFVDGDDLLAKDSLDIIYHNIESDIDIVAYEATKNICDLGGSKEFSLIDFSSARDYFINNIELEAEVSFVSPWLRAIRREVLLSNNIHFETKLFHEDNLFVVVITHFAGKVRQLPNILYFYRIHSGSVMHINTQRHARDMATISNKLVAFYSNYYQNFDTTIAKYISSLYRASILYSTPDFDSVLRTIICWRDYRRVSYVAGIKSIASFYLIFISPSFFRCIYSRLLGK